MHREEVERLTDDPELDAVLAQRDLCTQMMELWKKRIAIAFVTGTASFGATLLLHYLVPQPQGKLFINIAAWKIIAIMVIAGIGFVAGIVVAAVLSLKYRKLTTQAELLVHEDSFIAGIKGLCAGDIVGGYRIEAKHETLLHFRRMQSVGKVRARNIAFLVLGLILVASFIGGVAMQGLIISPAGGALTNLKLQLLFWALPIIGAGLVVLSFASTPLQIIVSRDHKSIILERCTKLAMRDTQIIPAASIEKIGFSKGGLIVIWQGRATELMKLEEIKEPSKGLLLAKTLAAQQVLMNVGAEIVIVLGFAAASVSEGEPDERELLDR